MLNEDFFYNIFHSKIKQGASNLYRSKETFSVYKKLRNCEITKFNNRT